MFFITHRKIFYTLISTLTAVCVGALIFAGLSFGIEFTGGSIVEVRYETDRPDKALLETQLAEAGFENASLRDSGNAGYLLRTKELTNEELERVITALGTPEHNPILDKSATVGPTIGTELQRKAGVAILLVALTIALYVAFAFRTPVEESDMDIHAPHARQKKNTDNPAPISSWMYGIIAILVLVHDIILPLGVIALLGMFVGLEIDVLIVTALLTILGYSVNDTIVIFDRVRERVRDNETAQHEEPFATTVGTALSHTYTRSINTSFTTLLVVLALLVFGGATTTNFALVLAVGVCAGTYSSLALAAPLLVSTHNYRERKRATTHTA
jgi:preprotein translocase subunit SecF